MRIAPVPKALRPAVVPVLMILTCCLIWAIRPTNALAGNIGTSGIYFKPPGEYLIRKVVIDAGHGGMDPGCIGPSKVQEKDIVLAISLKLGKMIEKTYPDVQVIYTRNKDVFVPLHERAAIANRHNADLFISIHCNSVANNKSASGTETWVLGLHRAKDNLDVAKRENASIYFERDYEKNYDGYDPKSPEAHILLSMFQNAFMEQSIFIAEKIEKKFVGQKRFSRGVKQGGLLVLRHATMPAVLVEAGFLSNPQEEAWLSTDKGQATIAQSVLEAFGEYKQSIEVFAAGPAPVADRGTDQAPGVLQASVSVPGGIEFCVQYYVSPQSDDRKGWIQPAKGMVRTRKEDNKYKFQVGGLGGYTEAQDMKSDLQKRGFKDAFIVAYRDTERISIQEALALADK